MPIAYRPTPILQVDSERSKTGIDAKLLKALTDRGITESKARSLITNLKPGQPLLDQVAHADLLIANGKIRNPAGFYVRFIEENNPVPKPVAPAKPAKAVFTVSDTRQYQAVLDDPNASEHERRLARAVLAQSNRA